MLPIQVQFQIHRFTMRGNFPIGLFFILLAIQLNLQAQHPETLPYGDEDFLYREESAEIPMEIFERYSDLRNNPLNINCATPDQLAESGLFSPFQVHILINYREKYGNLYSVYELASLTGFRALLLQEIAPYLTVGPCIENKYKGSDKHLILLNVGKIFPKAEGYGDSTKIKSGSGYSGIGGRTDVRIKSRMGNSLSMGLTYEKDAGERFLFNNRPEYMVGYLQYSGHRVLKQVVIGNFQLHHGLGLVNGTGFIHSTAGFLLNRRSMLRIRPYSSKSESRYERGLGLRLALRRIDLLGWVSYRKLDLSTAELSAENDEIDWREHIRESGLHRTNGETSGRNLGFRLHSGVQGLYRHKNLDVGILFGMESTGLSREGIDALGFAGNRGSNSYMSLHGNFQKGKWRVFSEFALSDWTSSALLAGVTMHLNDFIQGLLLLHHYDTYYSGSHPSSYASGSKINNEMGVAMHLQLEPGRLLIASFTGEVFHFPGPRYLSSVPSNGYRYGVTIRNSGAPEFKWRIRLSKKLWQSTPANTSFGLRSIQTSETTRCDLRFIYDHQLQWQSRLIFSYGSNITDSYPGYAIVQQISIHASQRLRTTIQFVVFEVQNWDHRIYLHEPGLYYDFSFPVCYGSGQKMVMTLAVKPFDKLTIAGKLALTSYQDRDTLGSGNDLIHGNEKWMLAMQLRLNL